VRTGFEVGSCVQSNDPNFHKNAEPRPWAVMKRRCALRAVLYSGHNMRRQAWISVFVLSLCAACSGSDRESGPGADDAGVLTDAEDDFRGCPEGIPNRAPGLQTMGEHLTVKVVAAVPAEPERYLNNWTVELGALDESPAPDAEIVRAETFMPIHGHDGRVQPQMTALSEPGQFRVDRLNFTMRGPWEVRLWLRSDALEDDYVVFDVCVAK